ncbi:hypothetical protein PMIN06_005811 [Paraphaeosphaeria minitans]
MFTPMLTKPEIHLGPLLITRNLPPHNHPHHPTRLPCIPTPCSRKRPAPRLPTSIPTPYSRKTSRLSPFPRPRPPPTHRQPLHQRTRPAMSPPAPRFPSAALTPAQQADLAAAETAVRDTFGPGIELKDAAGSLLGPFGPLSYTPASLAPYLAFAVAVSTTPLLTPRERELATLATTSVTRCDYVAYAHRKAGLSAGLSDPQVSAALAGKEVEGLSEKETVVYGLGLGLARGYGKVGDEVFEGAVGVLGRQGVSAVAQVVGAYALAGVLVGVAGVGAPAE